MTDKVWKNVVGYEGLYQVSSDGEVKSLPHYRNGKNSSLREIPEKILSPTSNGHYLVVGLVKNGKRKNKYIHRLVAEAFIPNYKNKPTVNHKWIDQSLTQEKNKFDNRVENLEWATHSEQTHHAYDNNFMNLNPLTGKDHVMSKAIIQINKYTDEFMAEYESMKEAAKATGVSYDSIRRIASGKTGIRSTTKYKWMFSKDYYQK